MAKKELVYELRIQGTDQEARRISEVEAELAKLRKQRKTYIDLMKEGVKLDEKTSKALAELTVKEKALGQEKAKLTKAINNQNNANTAAKGSYDSLTAANARLTAQIKRLEDPMGKNSATFKRLTSEVKKNEAQLKDMDAAMGRHQRNVGNYQQAITGAFGQLGLFSREMMVAKQAVVAMGIGFQGATKGVGAMSVAMRILKGVLISSGIGAIAVAIGSLAAYFTRSEEGAQRFKRIIVPLTVALGNLGDIAGKVGKVIVDLFSFNKKKIQDSWGELTKAVREFREETARESKEARENIDRETALLVRRRRVNEAIARNEIEIAKLRIEAEEKSTRSASERLAAIDKAAQLERANLNMRLEVARATLAIAEKEAEFATNKTEVEDELSQLRVNVLKAEEEHYTGMRRIITKQEELTRELAAEREKEWQVGVAAMRDYEQAHGQVVDMALRNEATMTYAAQQAAAQRNMIRRDEAEYQMSVWAQIASMASALFGEHTAAYKVTASAEALMSTYLSANRALAQLPIPANFAMAAVLTATGLANVAKINGIQFAGGGVIPSGRELPRSTPQGDNTLILAKPGEVVLNQRQQAALGGANTFRRIGVPGFADGGVIPNVDTGIMAANAMRDTLKTFRVELVEKDLKRSGRRVAVVEKLTKF